MSTARRGGDLPDQMVRNLLEQESLHRRQDHLQLLHLHPRSRRQLVRACPPILPVTHPRQGLLQPQRHGNFVFSRLSLCLLPVHSISLGCWYLRDRQTLMLAIKMETFNFGCFRRYVVLLCDMWLVDERCIFPILWNRDSTCVG